MHTKLLSTLTALLTCSLSAALPAAPYAPLDPRSAGMGGAGVAASGDFTPLLNPAHLAMVDIRRDVFMDFPLAAGIGTSSARFDDPLETFREQAAAYTAAPDATSLTAVENALAALNDRREFEQRFAGGVIGLPHLPVSLGAFVHGNDIQTRRAEVGRPDLTTDPANPVFDTRISSRDLLLIQSGAILAKVVRSSSGGANRLAFGISPKLMAARTTFNEQAAEFGAGSAPNQRQSESQFNADIGLIKEFGFVWKAGLVVRDLVPQTLAFGDPTRGELQLRPQVRAGIAYRSARALYAMDIDLTRNGAAGFEGATRELAVGAEFRLGERLRLRGGGFVNLLDGRAGATAGLGLSASFISLDIAGFGDSQRRVGAAAKLGLRF